MIIFFAKIHNRCLLSRLDQLDLHAQETPNISFRADLAAVRDVIHNFGRVDANGLPLETSAFVGPETPSPCLPRVFEDYEDAEHHVLYKTVSELNSNQAGNVSCFPLFFNAASL